MASRICRHVGEEDPEQWLEDADEQLLNHWQAYHRLEPFGGEQELLATICGLLWHLCLRETDKPKELAERLGQLKASFMPGDWIGHKAEQKKTSEANFDAAAELLQRAFS